MLLKESVEALLKENAATILADMVDELKRKSVTKDVLDEAIADAFRRFDKDGSGTIDASELGDALATVLGRRPKREVVRQLLKDADADGNGTLDFDEWMALARRGGRANRELLNPKPGAGRDSIVARNDASGGSLR